MASAGATIYHTYFWPCLLRLTWFSRYRTCGNMVTRTCFYSYRWVLVDTDDSFSNRHNSSWISFLVWNVYFALGSSLYTLSEYPIRHQNLTVIFNPFVLHLYYWTNHTATTLHRIASLTPRLQGQTATCKCANPNQNPLSAFQTNHRTIRSPNYGSSDLASIDQRTKPNQRTANELYGQRVNTPGNTPEAEEQIGKNTHSKTQKKNHLHPREVQPILRWKMLDLSHLAN